MTVETTDKDIESLREEIKRLTEEVARLHTCHTPLPELLVEEFVGTVAKRATQDVTVLLKAKELGLIWLAL